MASCEVNQIFLGEVASVQNYGAFVRIPGCSQQGLVHRSQVSSTHVDDVSDVLQRGESVWCKVISLGEDGKIALSMKHVNQGNGNDLDPNGVQLQRDEQKRKSMVPGQRKAIQLEAVLNTTCGKCGTPGHLSSDCFMSADGKTYELLPEMEEEKIPEKIPVEEPEKAVKKHKSKKSKSKKKTKKSKHRGDSCSSDSNSGEGDSRRKSKKKHSKERKKRKKKTCGSSSDEDDSSGSSRDLGSRKRSHSENNEKHSKKCKRSRSKH